MIELPELTVSHAALLTEVHVHPLGAVTATVPVVRKGDAFISVTDSVRSQVDTPSCVIVTSMVATVKVAVRAFTEVFAVTLNPSVPGPVPLLPDVMVTQPGRPETDQEQEEAVGVTPRVPCIPEKGA